VQKDTCRKCIPKVKARIAEEKYERNRYETLECQVCGECKHASNFTRNYRYATGFEKTCKLCKKTGRKEANSQRAVRDETATSTSSRESTPVGNYSLNDVVQKLDGRRDVMLGIEDRMAALEEKIDAQHDTSELINDEVQSMKKTLRTTLHAIRQGMDASIKALSDRMDCLELDTEISKLKARKNSCE
jgi:uncharacterized coiled-coil protein SlyX